MKQKISSSVSQGSQRTEKISDLDLEGWSAQEAGEDYLDWSKKQKIERSLRSESSGFEPFPI